MRVSPAPRRRPKAARRGPARTPGRRNRAAADDAVGIDGGAVARASLSVSMSAITTGMGDARVAVVIASRNRREVLLRTLSRLSALPERPRIVLVDNASTDGSADMAEAIGVDVIRMERNIGGAVRNFGIEAGDAPYVALCDDDSWWRPGALRRAADLFDRHSRLAAINGHVLVGAYERVDPSCEEMARSVLP